MIDVIKGNQQFEWIEKHRETLQFKKEIENQDKDVCKALKLGNKKEQFNILDLLLLSQFNFGWQW